MTNGMKIEHQVDWLLDSDPAIRWQVLGDLTDASPDEGAAERARVERDGWGARLLALEGADGLWDGGALFPASYTGGEPGQPWAGGAGPSGRKRGGESRGSPGRRRCTPCSPCRSSGSIRRARRRAARSRSSPS